MEHFTDIGQSIEEGLERQKRELQEAGFIPDISSAGHFTLKDRSGQTVLEGELINKQLVFSQLQVTEDIKELAKDYFISTIAQEHIAKENEKIIEEGLENMQVNGGRSDAAMEADYEYEQFSSPEMEETEEESFGFENFTAEALLHLAEISPEAYESLKKEYEQRTGLSADEYLKKAGDKDRQEKKESLISQRLKSLLEAQEMTIQELAIKAGVTEAAMLRYINGERIPRGAILLNVANAFGVSVEQITGKEFPFTVGEEIPLDTFTSSYGGENWIIEKINENNVQLGRSTDNIVIQHEGKVMSKEDFLEAVQAIHPELVNTVVEKNPPEQKPDIATSFVLEKLKSVGIEVITDKNEFEKILHKETLLQKSMKQLSSDEINAYFSFNKDDIERFNKSLDDWEKNKKNPRQLIVVGKIPPVMKALGISDKPIQIENSVIAKILRPQPIFPHDKQGHNLTMDDVRAIPKLLADPVMVFTSRTREDSYVFFTERKDSENRSIIIPIAVNKRKGRIIINEITSMYGKDNETAFIRNNIEKGNLIYIDEHRLQEWEKKISPVWKRESQIQFLGRRPPELQGYIDSILTKERLVNFISSRQLMISDGTTYGFAYNGKIYLNPDFLNSNVAVHEYTHLWDKYIQNTNPELWERGKEAFKKTSLWEQVKNDPSYTDITGDDDLILSECHARICGEIAQSVLEKIAQEDGQIAKDAVIDWDKETWTYIAQNFTQDIASFIEVKDFMNLPIKDLMNEKKLSYEQATPAKEKYKYDENDEQTRHNNLLVYNFMFDSDNDSDYYGAIKLNDKFNFSEFADFHLMNAVETFNEQIEFNKKKEKKAVEQYHSISSRKGKGQEERLEEKGFLLEDIQFYKQKQRIIKDGLDKVEKELKKRNIDLEAFKNNNAVQSEASVTNESSHTELIINNDTRQSDNLDEDLEAEKQLLSQFMPPEQLFTTLDLLAGEEGSFFAGKIKEIATAIEKAPKIYETDGMKEHPVILRYFHPTGSETLVCEIGTNGEAFGYQVINGDWVNSEFGYLDINEIKNIPGMEIDYHFPENMSIERWLYTQSPKHFQQYADLFEQPTQETPMQAPTQETITPINMNELHNTMVLNGNTYPVVEIEASLEKDLQEIFKTFIPEPYIGGVKIYHNPEEPGKINLLVQYGTDKIEGEWTEEALSNDLKREHITFNGIEVNVKAISPDRTGTIDEYLAMLEENNIMIEHEGQFNQTSGIDISSDNLDAKKPETIGDIDVETLRKALKTALEETAEELPYTPFTRENYNTLFPYSKVETPLGAVKLGAHQFEKLEQKDRQYILQAVHDTLADPSIVIKETGKDVFGEDKISNIFAKSYIFPSDKARAIQSVVVSIDGENISITTHQRDISNVVNKIKKPDQLLFAAAKVRLLVERMDKPVTVNPTSESGYAEPLNDSIREDFQKVNKHETQFFSQSFNLEGKTSTEKVKEITEKLKTGVNEIFESGQYEQYLKVMSKFHDYSTNNTILIALQRPDATRVAGFTTWKNEFQRSVKKGEKGIKILAPMFFKKEPQEKDVPDSETHSSENHEQEENEEQIITRFKVVNVFDICQTEGKELPRLGVDALKGDVEHYEAFYHSLEKTSPVPMAFEAIKDASHGYYDLVDKRIAIKAGLSQLQTIKTAIHEIAHATLHADKNSNTDRSTAEVQAESIAYTVCSYYGLDTSDYSFGYVAGWSRGKEIKELKDSLEIIRKTSSQIITDIDKHFSQIQEKQVIKEKQKTAFAQLELFSREELSNTPSIRKLMMDQALNREHITAGKAALRKYSESVLSGKQEGLWKSFYQFKTKGVFDIVGSKITLNKEGTLTDTSWNQLHTALKIYRDKRFETFRYLFVDNKGMIKDQLTLCSYLPNRTVATLPGKNIIPNIIKHAEETQTRIILAHNHPSGSTSPSFEDVLTTQKLKRIFTNSRGKSLLLGHIILDHDTAEIYDNSKANWYTIQTNKTNKDPLTKNDPLAKTELYSSLLLNSVCRQINETDTWKAKGFVPLVFVSGDKKVSAIKMYPESFFSGSQEDVLKELQHIGSQTGSNWCFPIVQNRKDISQNCIKNIRRLFEKKCFMDYMIEKEIGTELNSSYGGGIFDAISAEERQKRIKIESTFYLDKNNNTIATNTGVLICNEENEVKENTLPEKLFTTKEIKSGQSHTGILKESYLVSQNFFPPMTEKDGTISIYCSSKDLNMPVYALNPNEPVKVNMTKKQVAVLLDTAIKTHILKVKNTKDFKITLPEKSNPNPDFAKMLMSVTPGISYEGIKKEYNKIFNSVSKEMNALRIQACKSQSPSRPLPQKRVYSGGMEY